MGQFGAEIEQAMRDYEAKILERLRDYICQNNWEAFINTSLCNPQVLAKAFTVYDDVPDSLKYQFAIDAYTHTGDRLPGVRKAVRGLRKYGKPELPEEIATQDTITVYRAGEESIGKAPYRLSWTTDKRVAELFLNDYCRSTQAICSEQKSILPTLSPIPMIERNERSCSIGKFSILRT